MISIHEAFEHVRTAVHPLASEAAPLDAAQGRFLAADILAPWDLPTRTHAAMDGFAVRASETAGASESTPVTRQIVGRICAGDEDPGQVGPGQAVAITTGSRMPAGATAVVRIEDATERGEDVAFAAAIAEGHNVRHQGEYVRAGAPVLSAGTRIDAHAIGVLAAFGSSRVEVRRQAVVAIVANGDELVTPAEASPAAVVDSNSPMLAAMAREAGARVEMLGPVPDREEALSTELGQAARTADVLVTVAGASVGERDLTRRVLEGLGAEFVFHKVAIKPGKPVGFARLGDTWVFMLPGNPGAAAMTFELFVRPALFALHGAIESDRRWAHGILGTAVQKRPGRSHCVWSTARLGPAGLQLDALEPQSSGSSVASLGHNAIAILPASASELAPGHAVPVRLLAPPKPRTPRPVLGVAGFSNTGKTTLVADLVARLSRDLRVGVVKHGHKFHFDRKGKDTYRFAEAGAIAVAFASPTHRGMAIRSPHPPELDEVLASLPGDLDCVLVEGYKLTAIPKIEMVGEDGKCLTHENALDNVLALVRRGDELRDERRPVFAAGDLDGIEAWVRDFIARSRDATPNPFE